MSVTKQILERLRKDINTFGAATITHNELCIVEARFEALSAKLAEAEQRLTYAYAAKARCNDDANFERKLRLATEARVVELEKALTRVTNADFLDFSLAPERSAVPIASAALAATKEPKP
jgi:hypothetical protein